MLKCSEGCLEGSGTIFLTADGRELVIVEVASCKEKYFFQFYGKAWFRYPLKRKKETALLYFVQSS